jgi:hypothetical protein
LPAPERIKNNTTGKGTNKAKDSRGGNAEKLLKKPRVDNMPSNMSQTISRAVAVRKIDLNIVVWYNHTKFRSPVFREITKIAILTVACTE